MILFKKGKDLIHHVNQFRSSERMIGFVPTMGALHAGHLSLVELAKTQTDLVVCSIFVNPTQFNDAADFRRYPIHVEKDIYLLEKIGSDILFLPSLDEIYPGGTAKLEQYDLGRLESVLEGKFRPGHFQGVCQVMHRLLDIVQPQQLFMGQKDFQQCMVIRRLLGLIQAKTVLHTCPTRREPDGLAMSSRNVHLSPPQRQKASALFKALNFLRIHLRPGALQELIEQATDILGRHDFRIDYVEISDRETLEPVGNWNGQTELVALGAAFQDNTRLIDNVLLPAEPN